MENGTSGSHGTPSINCKLTGGSKMTIQELAKEASEHFITKTRDNGTNYTCNKDNAYNEPLVFEESKSVPVMVTVPVLVISSPSAFDIRQPTKFSVPDVVFSMQLTL